MLDISWAELLFIAVVAIIVIGPKDLPRALRAVGQWTGKARRMAGDFQRQFNEAIREAELDTVKDQVTNIGKIDPVGSVRKEIGKVEAGIKGDLKAIGETAKPTEPESATASESAPVKTEAAPPAPETKADAAAKPEPATAPSVASGNAKA
ncbi:Sec-independent protein translocase protein TatB [Bauldia sp.]|uniref:Sec-independent protein translocase protein TatB n=1 Tax=Bauldia sp. TaxID=2575872 RepID=UPI003BAB6DCA